MECMEEREKKTIFGCLEVQFWMFGSGLATTCFSRSTTFGCLEATQNPPVLHYEHTYSMIYGTIYDMYNVHT
jgi:hypothetical protein